MNKRIALVIERVDTGLGGAERSIMELAAALGQQGLSVDILAAGGHQYSDKVHLLCQDHPKKRVGFSVFARSLRDHLARNKYDIVHSVLPFGFADIYQPRGGSYAESIRRNAASYSNRLRRHYKRLTAFANTRRTTLLRAEKMLCKDPQGPRVIALSRYVAEQFQKHYGLNENRIEIIPNGVKIGKLPEPAKADVLRKQITDKLRIRDGQNPVFFLFAANNFRLKGLAPLLEAIHLAKEKNGFGNCCLIAAGRSRSFKYRLLGRKHGIKDKIVFLGKVRNIEDVLSISDVAVLPTFYDPASRFTLEALAAGKPVITTRYNGATDLFENGRHGIVVSAPTATAELADALIHFTDPANIKAVTENITQDNLKEKISVDRVAKQLMAIYQGI